MKHAPSNSKPGETGEREESMGEEEKVVCPKCGAEMANGKFGIYCSGHCGFRIGKERVALLKRYGVLDE